MENGNAAENTTEWERIWAILRWGIAQNIQAISFHDLPQNVIHRIRAEYPYTAEEQALASGNLCEVLR